MSLESLGTVATERAPSTSPDDPSKKGDQPSALAEAKRMKNQYSDAASKAKRRFHLSEILLLVVSASITTTGLLIPAEARIPALLGLIALVIAGLRSIFHWQEDYLRFTNACSGIEFNRRLYEFGVPPYDDPCTRDVELISRIAKIEVEETQGWMSMIAETSNGKKHS